MTHPKRSQLVSVETGAAYKTFIAGRYSLEDVIGKGGMGEVWSAYDRKLGRRVALKIVEFREEKLPETKARFRREIEFSTKLVGPAFPEVFSHGELPATPGRPERAFLAMELLEGETLQERLTRVGSLTIAESLDLLAGVAVALRASHARRIVHRDLKPSNVFFAKIKPGTSGTRPRDGRNEVVKLLDFGIAVSLGDPADLGEIESESRLTRPGIMMGSAHYMSPEQIGASKAIDTRADLWSIAVVLYRALAGRKPFDGHTPEALAKILRDKPPAASSLKPELSAGVDWFFDTALQKDPAKRFQTINEMVDAFHAAVLSIASDPPTPRPSDLPTPLGIEVIWESKPPPKGPPPLPPRARVSQEVERPLPVQAMAQIAPRAVPIAVRTPRRSSLWGAVLVAVVAFITIAVARLLLRR